MRPGPPPAELPPAVPGMLRVRDAGTLAIGAARLRAADLDRSVHGIRSRMPLRGLRDRAAALLLRLGPRAFVSHVSALALHGAPLPVRHRDDDRIDLAVPAPQRAPHAKGIRGHRVADPVTDRRHVLPVSTPATAWAEAATLLTVPELVGVADFLLHPAHPLCSVAELGAIADAAPPQRAGGRLRTALTLIDPLAESFPESLLRALLRQAGLPAPVVNRSVTARGSTYRPDLAFPARRVVVEYQGDYHRDRAQWLADRRRRADLEAVGWTVIEAAWSDIADPAPLVARLRGLGVR